MTITIPMWLFRDGGLVLAGIVIGSVLVLVWVAHNVRLWS